jgi:hypothetical protein
MKFLLTALLISIFFLGQIVADEEVKPRYNMAGLDMEILSYGGSLGGYWAYQPTAAWGLNIETDWSLVESKDTFSYLNYYGQPVSFNSRNLSFVKVLVGSYWYPFLEVMHSSVQIGGFASAGPVFALNTADDEDLFERWQDVEVDIAPMARAGVQVRIVSGQGTFYTFKIGYDYAEFDKFIDSRKTYKGPFFQAGMEFLRK